MDIPVYITLGLLASGYMLNGDTKQARPGPVLDPKVRNDEHENKKSGNRNIYDSAMYKRVQEIEDERVIKNFEKSFDPINTNVIPFFFNSLQETNVKRVKNPQYNNELFKKELAKLTENTPIAITRLEPTVNDLSVLSQDASVESGGFSGDPPRGLYADTTLNKDWGELITRPEADRDLNNREGFTANFTHNNMVPFFSGQSAGQNMDLDNRRLTDKLETFTGQFKLNKAKRETDPLFAPVQQNLEQLAAPRELDRFSTATQIRNNELPFEQIKVGPGLNDGYTARPSGGFHNPLRVLPKNIDQLLVNPKQVTEGRVVRGKAIDKRTASQEQYKYRPELLVTNFNGERNFTTVGAYTKPKARPKQVIKDTNRQKSRELIGIAHEQHGSKTTPSKLLPFGKMSTKVSFKNTPFRNAVKAEGKKAHNGAQFSYENRRNERAVSQIRYGIKGHNLINPKSQIDRGQIYFVDQAKTTRQQAYINNPNQVGYLAKGILKGQAYNSNAQTKTTHRQTTENNSHKGNVGQSQQRGKVINTLQSAKATVREDTGKTGHQGALSGTQKGQLINPNLTTKVTHREISEKNSHLGMSSLQSKGQVQNSKDMARTTGRELNEVNTHSGQLQSQIRKGQTPSQGQMKTTIRELDENSSRNGELQTGVSKGWVKTQSDLARTTIRETEENNTRQGEMQSGAKKGWVQDQSATAKTTHRESLEDNSYQGQLQTAGGKGWVQNPNNQARQTIRQDETNSHQGQLQVGGGKGLVYAPGDQARQTIRQDQEDNSYTGQLQSGIKFGQSYNPNDRARQTIREQEEINSYMGQLNAGRQAGQAYNPNIQVRETIRETEENNTHEGNLHVNGGKSYVYDPFEGTAKTTIREGTEGNNHQGQLQTGVAKGSLHNLQSAKTTIKETSEDNNHGGHMSSSAVKKGSVYTGVARTTIREDTENQSANTGQVSSNIRRGQSKITDDARVTHRQTTEDNSHSGQVGQAGHKGQVYQGVAKGTIREDTERQNHGGHVQNGVSRGQTYAQGPAKTTVREQTEKQSHQGQLGGATRARTHAQDQAKTTHRQTTENHNTLGAVGTSDNVRGNAFDAQDPNNSARTTIKETTESSADYKGAVGGSSKVALTVYDPNINLKMTSRQFTGATNNTGIMGGSQKTKGSVYDPFEIAKRTIREDTENQSYLAPVEAKYSEKGGYITAPTDVKNVNRALLADYYYTGGAGPAEAPENPMSQEDAHNMRQNINKEVVAEGRYPTLSNVKLTLGKTGMNIEIKKLDQDRLNQYSAVRAPTIPAHTPAANHCQVTSFKNNLPEWNPTLDPEILSAYNSNPLAKSLHSWA